MILTIVHPLCHTWLGITYELMSVELTSEILSCTTTERTTRVDIQQEHPLVVIHFQ